MPTNLFTQQHRKIFQTVSVLVILAFNLSPLAPAFALTPTTGSASGTKGTPGTQSANTSPSTPVASTPSTNARSNKTVAPASPPSNSSQTSSAPLTSPQASHPLVGGGGGSNPPTVTSPNVFTYGSVSPQVNGKTGALTEVIPLDIPPGRNGLQPNLSLDYNSQNTDQDGIVGYGWTVSIPYIVRLNKTGSQNMYSNTQYFSSSIDGELATTTSNYTFRPRVDDSGSFDLYSFATSTNTWTVYDKNGTEYLYGASDQSRLESTSTPVMVYKWMLEKVIDTNGNYVRYVYNKDENQIYPYEVIYTGNRLTDGPMTITFATSTRPDKVMSFKGGFEVDTNYRISQITAAVNGTTVRQYNLSYTTGDNGTRSLLSSVQENGWDDFSVETSFPAMSFGYVSSSTPFVGAVGSGTVSGDPYIASDINGNGMNDAVNIACNPSSGGQDGYIYPDGGTSSTFTPPQVSSLFWSYGSNGTGSLNETGTRFLDVNANGKAEIVQGSYTGTTGAQVTGMYLNNYATSSGYAWVATTTYTGVIPAFDSRSTSTAPFYTSGFFGDVNGDGLPDFELALSTSTTESSLNGMYFGNGSAWNGATTTIFTPAKTVPVGASDCTASQ